MKKLSLLSLIFLNSCLSQSIIHNNYENFKPIETSCVQIMENENEISSKWINGGIIEIKELDSKHSEFTEAKRVAAENGFDTVIKISETLNVSKRIDLNWLRVAKNNNYVFRMYKAGINCKAAYKDDMYN
jgi:hypothetical protein